jgi:hypothetical protein
MGEASTDLGDDMQGYLGGHPETLTGAAGEDVEKVRPVDELHRDVPGPLDLSELVDLDHVRVIEEAAHLRFCDEELDEVLVDGEFREDALDDEDLFEAAWPNASSTKDLGHAASADSLEQLVLSELDRKARFRRDQTLSSVLGRETLGE